ncbi:MAG: hypothetical protein ACTHJM_10590 [Marmoricola sp.]
MSMMQAQPRKRPRHLIDPADLGKPRPSGKELADERESLDRVRRWVASTLIVTTILHLVVGLIIAAWVLPDHPIAPRIGLLGIAGFFGMVSVATGQLIHRRSPFNAWLLLGLVPAVAGAIWIF